MKTGNFQEKLEVNVCVELIGTRIIGKIFFQGFLTGEKYLVIY